ncbi:MAG: hypothetical protein ACOZNI_30645 [Myxococcota bacterium]
MLEPAPSAVAPRISLRAVVAGTLVALAALWVLMVAAGALGLWSLGIVDAEALSRAGIGLGIWAGVAWPLAVLFGAYTTSRLSGVSAPGDGAFHGLVTWASTCVTAGVMGCVWFMSAVKIGVVDLGIYEGLDSSAMMWGMFVSEALAIGASVVGGRAGVAVFGPSERAPRGLREPTPTPP